MKRSIFILRLFSAFIIMSLCFVSFVPCFASAVKAPVFSFAPENVTFISGTSGVARACASVFGDTKTEIRYYLEVLKGIDFVSEDTYSRGKSGSSVNIKIITGKGAKLLSRFGVYTARVRAVSVDANGDEIAQGYSPVFKINVLAPFIKSLNADTKLSYGEPFTITAEINPACEEAAAARYFWTVFDGKSSVVLSEGSVVHGITFTGTSTPVLKGEGKPDGFFTMSFKLSAAFENASKQQVSEDVSVDFRAVRTVGFSLGESGMKYFKNDGRYAVGWLRCDGSIYYFDENGFMATGERKIDGKSCYFGFDGRLICGFIKTPLGLKYYEDGKITVGWHVAADGVKYYFEEATGYMTAKTNSDGEVVYFTDYGAMTFRTDIEN